MNDSLFPAWKEEFCLEMCHTVQNIRNHQYKLCRMYCRVLDLDLQLFWHEYAKVKSTWKLQFKRFKQRTSLDLYKKEQAIHIRLIWDYLWEILSTFRNGSFFKVYEPIMPNNLLLYSSFWFRLFFISLLRQQLVLRR